MQQMDDQASLPPTDNGDDLELGEIDVKTNNPFFELPSQQQQQPLPTDQNNLKQHMIYQEAKSSLGGKFKDNNSNNSNMSFK